MRMISKEDFAIEIINYAGNILRNNLGKAKVPEHIIEDIHLDVIERLMKNLDDTYNGTFKWKGWVIIACGWAIKASLRRDRKFHAFSELDDSMNSIPEDYSLEEISRVELAIDLAPFFINEEVLLEELIYDDRYNTDQESTQTALYRRSRVQRLRNSKRVKELLDQ